MAAGAAALVSAPAMEAKDCNGVALLLDGGNCLTRESAAGYRQVLDSFESRFRTIIVPVNSALSLPTLIGLRRKAEAGYSVILESGLTFADTRETERQCALIGEVFGVHIELASSPPAGKVSYLQYRWPVDVLVRQFGQTAVVSGTQCQSIAYLGGATVAARKPIGSGRLIFLGSPLGPMLMAGDPEATLLARRMLIGS